MHIISIKMLREFWQKHPEAEKVLREWHSVVEHAVPQGNLSAILAGKRKISAALAGKLGKFFGVSPALFVPA